MTDTTKRASTGSIVDDESDKSHEGVVEHTGEIVTIPGEIKRQRIVIDHVPYTHVGEDGDGRWIYRA